MTLHLQALAECRDANKVGGKAINLGEMIRAGFPVPGGFVITTDAYREAGGEISNEMAEAIQQAYQAMGSPLVAVRSSATAEDRADASMAGQYETVLNVKGPQALLDAIQHCWKSVHSERTESYLTKHGISLDEVAMAVVVQQQIEAEVAGVCFTANPKVGATHEILIDGSWGLGESVVSGEVQPDSFALDRETGVVLRAFLGEKQTWRPSGGQGVEPTPEDKRSEYCLDATQLKALCDLCKQVADRLGAPQDLEWAFMWGELYLLQSRHITTIDTALRAERILSETKERLKSAAEAGQGPWVEHNLGETLPHPTPLTWSIIQPYMSGAGGFGNLYRMAGFEPSEEVCTHGILERLGGAIYMDLDRASDLFFEDFPFAYDPDLLRRRPGAAQEAPTVPTGTVAAQRAVSKKMEQANQQLDAKLPGFDKEYTGEILPAFEQWVREEKAIDLSQLSTEALLEKWQSRRVKVLDEFAPLSLLPGFLLNRARWQLQTLLAEHFWDEHPESLLEEISAGEAPDSSLLSADLLAQANDDEEVFATWLARFGHRAPNELELSVPRWRERPEDAKRFARNTAGDGPRPLEKHTAHIQTARTRIEALLPQVPEHRREELKDAIELVQRYQPFREDGKHALMMGYDLLRDLLLESQRRLDCTDLAFLTLDELAQSLSTGFAPLSLIAERKADYQAEKELHLPPFIEPDTLDELGVDAPLESGSDHFDALPISPGFGSGPVRILHAPEDVGSSDAPFVLVCPSTDPSWTPLFSKATAVILERGGLLSHGAVVARELGLPAVVLPGATRRFKDGDLLRVNGSQGQVSLGLVGDADATEATAEDEQALLPPPVPGQREARSAKIRNRWLAFWAVFLGAFFLLPAPVLQQPVNTLLDMLLLPVAASKGWALLILSIAGAFATLTMLVQWKGTDTPRLREARKRTKAMEKGLKNLPEDDPRRKEYRQQINAVQGRILAASLFPLALFLGPMMLAFLWLPTRVDPSLRNAQAGSPVTVRVRVSGEYTNPVRLTHDEALNLESITPAEQANPPIRATLKQLERDWSRTQSLPADTPWSLRTAGEWAAQQTLADLRAYLAQPLPDQWLSWRLTPKTNEPGHFPVSLSTVEGEDQLGSEIVLGSFEPVQPTEVISANEPMTHRVQNTDPDSPLKELRIVPSRQPQKNAHIVWRPLAVFGNDWGIGWLMTYLIGYLPPMLLLKKILRLP